MKIPNRLIIPAVILFLSGSLVAASVLSASPGSAQDPLITESYLLQLLEKEQEAREAMAERLATVEKMLQNTDAFAVAQLEERLGSIEARLQGGVTGSSSEATDFSERLVAIEQQLRELKITPGDTLGSADNNPLALQVVSLQEGEAVYAGAGAEIILRSGTLRVLAPTTGGIANLTGAEDLQQGDLVPKNHHLLVPRDDERGFEALSDAVFLLRGTIRYR